MISDGFLHIIYIYCCTVWHTHRQMYHVMNTAHTQGQNRGSMHVQHAVFFAHRTETLHAINMHRSSLATSYLQMCHYYLQILFLLSFSVVYSQPIVTCGRLWVKHRGPIARNGCTAIAKDSQRPSDQAPETARVPKIPLHLPHHLL